MMGQLELVKNTLFYDFCIERHILAYHSLCQIDQLLDIVSFSVTWNPFAV